MEKRIISLTIILTIILTNIMQVMLPVVSRAESSITIGITQDKTDLHKVTIKVKSESPIAEFKYVKKHVESSYFKTASTSGEVTSVKDFIGQTEYSADLNLEYGNYTFYVKDQNGNIKTSQTTIAPKETPQVSVSNNGLNLLIKVKGVEAKITKVKVGKRNSLNEEVNFSSEGKELLDTPVLEKTLTYNAPENGIYDVYAENEYGSSYKIEKIVLLPEGTNQIEVSYTVTQKEITITATDAIVNINKMKIALATDASTKEDFATKGTEIPITSGKTVTQDYEVNEGGTYNIYVEDELGFTSISQIIIKDEDDIIFSISESELVKKVTATSSNGKITKLRVAYSKSESAGNLNWNDIEITPAKSVSVNISKVTDVDKYAYVYAESDQSRNEMISFLISANSSNSDTTPPTITLTQDPDNLTKINVDVKDEINNLSEVKYALGEQDISYFENDGTELLVPDSQKEMSTSFNISDVGTYTVYAKDSKGNETTEKITVNKIAEEEDTTGPTITTAKEKIDNSTIRIKITATDESSSIKVIKIAPNEQDIGYFSNNGTTLDQTTDENSAIAYVDAKSNGTYTIYAEDSKGNASVSNITVTEIGTGEEEKNNTNGENNINNNSNTDDDNYINNNSNTGNSSNTGNGSKNNGSSSFSTRNDGTGKTKVQTISAGDSSSSSSSKKVSLPYTGGIKCIFLVLIIIVSIFGIVEYKKYKKTI